MSASPALRDTALLLIRLLLATIFAAHGWTKFSHISETIDSFTSMGIPLASISAWTVAFVELIGGVALLIGIFTRIVAGVFALLMMGAFFLVHLPNGVFVSEGGFELAASLAAACLGLVVAGAGRVSLDGLTDAHRARLTTVTAPATT